MSAIRIDSITGLSFPQKDEQMIRRLADNLSHTMALNIPGERTKDLRTYLSIDLNPVWIEMANTAYVSMAVEAGAEPHKLVTI